ncbi:MAG: hypothetical protein KC656_13480 [Myxococcales bacterium]|nr:hypothetical protein [Myxococcales bacterium]MCB9663898.1 hypothetical protein [Alphaproteobacteria bacterium]
MLAVLLGGCVERSEAPRVVADAFCARLGDCRPAVVTEAYGDQRDCRNVHRLGFEALDAGARALDCTYDGQVVADCVAALRGADCASFDPEGLLDACVQGWSCAGDPLLELETEAASTP